MTFKIFRLVSWTFLFLRDDANYALENLCDNSGRKGKGAAIFSNRFSSEESLGFLQSATDWLFLS